MLDAPYPDDEPLRLADLRALDVLDTSPELRFDRITRTAQQLFDVPIALVSLIDADRQWFKSRAGLCNTQTPRNISFCGHAIHQQEAFVVPDASIDPRFADNPLVTGDLHLRFYAGMPLKSRHGRALGTLCLIDRQPRQMSEVLLEQLADLAAWAERELNLRELQDANADAEKSSRRLRVVLDSTADAIIAIDERLFIHTFNRSAEQMFGLREDDMLDKPLSRILSPEGLQQVSDSIRALIRNHQFHMVLPSTVQLPCGDGGTFYADLRLGRTEISGQPCFTLIIRDVTEQHELDKMKSAFIATVSHELRTPLTSIKGSVNLLQAVASSMLPRDRRLLDIASANCERLSQMVNDILDLEKLDCRQMRMDMRSQSLAPCLRNALMTMQAFADTLGVTLKLDLDMVDTEAICDYDESRIMQVTVNLLSNAIKFSPKGARVHTRLEKIHDRLRISVIDQGRGIPEEFRKRIFQRFSQADAQSVRGHAGSGLGLAISKAIVEQHGGSIGFHSETDYGSHFYFDLPCVPSAIDACNTAETLGAWA